MTRFKFNGNLDAPGEALKFITTYCMKGGPRTLAKRLGFTGRGAVKAAEALRHYASYRRSATAARRDGNIETAQTFESICDRIYTRDIQPNIECW